MFFFQAEDGIRDLVRSRGLGDVYKRQILIIVFMTVDACELAVIVRVVVAIGAGVPFPIVPSAVDREVLIIVIES